jgi:dehydrogenase/reductase SDR family protein 1
VERNLNAIMWRISTILTILLSFSPTGWSFAPAAPSSQRVATRSATIDDSSVDVTPTSQALKLEGCVCLVTGASRGIGKGIALELGRQGAIVYITGTSSGTQASSGAPYTSTNAESGPGTIEETAEQVTASGGTGIAVLCNHGIDTDVQQLMQRIDEEHGRLDILINNAFRMPKGSVEGLNKKFWELDIEVWDNLHQVGLRSHYVASHFAMPLLLKSARAKKKPAGLARPLVGMIGSFGGLTYTFNLPYGVGKAAVDRLAKDMAIEVKEEDICVVSFWPGVVMTERTEIAVENGDWDKYVGVPLDNAESPEFTGKAIVAVATDPDNMLKTGMYQVVAELAQEYGFTDRHGRVPPSIRSLRFLLPSYAFDASTRDKIPSWLIPDWKLPFWVMAQGAPPKPTEK